MSFPAIRPPSLQEGGGFLREEMSKITKEIRYICCTLNILWRTSKESIKKWNNPLQVEQKGNKVVQPIGVETNGLLIE